MHRSSSSTILAAFAVVCCLAGIGWASMRGWSLAWPLGLLEGESRVAPTTRTLLVFLLPGLLLAAAALLQRLCQGDQAPRLQRIGGMLLVLAGLCWAGMGWWTMDPRDLDGSGSQMHASLWMAWTLCLLSGGLARALTAQGAARAVSVTLAGGGFALAWWGTAMLPAGTAQLLAFACWVALLAWVPVSGGAVSTPG